MDKKSKRMLIAWCAVIVIVLAASLVDDYHNDFSDYLRSQEDAQFKQSESIMSKMVSSSEGLFVGDHEISGSNWAIPNIIG